MVMNLTQKQNKINLIKENIRIYEALLRENPNDELSRDQLNFNKHRLMTTESTLTDEELMDEDKFNLFLLNQKEKINSLKANEKNIKNAVIYFSSEKISWNIKYQIDYEEKNKKYDYNEIFLKYIDDEYEKLIKKHGKKIASEYDKILYGVLNRIDDDLGTDLSNEYLNNNETYRVLYDLRPSTLKRKYIKQLKKSYKNNSNRNNMFIVTSNKKKDMEIYKSVLTLPKIENEIKKELEEESFVKEQPEKIDNNLFFTPENSIQNKKEDLIEIKDKLENIKNNEEIEVLDNKEENNLSLQEILGEEEIEVLDDDIKKIA